MIAIIIARVFWDLRRFGSIRGNMGGSWMQYGRFVDALKNLTGVLSKKNPRAPGWYAGVCGVGD
jgi:hypothetical protein